MKLLYFLLGILFFLKVNSQVNEIYYNDVESKEGGELICHLKYNNSVIIGGTTFGKKPLYPNVMRVDTLGNTVWDTSMNDTSNYNPGFFKITNIVLTKEGFLYAFCSGGSKNEIWKIDPSNGAILVKKKIMPMYTAPRFFLDCDSSRLIFTYHSAYLSGAYVTRLVFINKLTCDTLSTHYLGKNNYLYAVGMDNQKNIYYTLYDTLCKRNAINFNTIIYKTKHPTAQIDDYHYLYCDSATACVYLMGKTIWPNIFAKIVKANASSGAHISNVAIFQEVNCQDFKVANGHLFTTWRHMYVGAGTKPFYITKYNMAPGTLDWYLYYPFVGVGTPDTHSGGSQSAMSMDLDNNGDIYLSGYYGDANYGPENWGILKVNGTAGTSVYEKTIAEDTIKYNNISVGLATYIINNKVYSFGQLETYWVNGYEREKLTMVKLNPLGGTVLLKKYLGSNHQFPSQTLSIKKYPSSKTLVMKQTGRMVQVEMYDFAKNLLWSKSLSRSYYTFSGQLETNAAGDIFVTASSRQYSTAVPYYSATTDSMYLYKLNASGNVVNSYQFYVGQTNVSLVELDVDNASALMFYQKSNVIYFRVANTSTISAENNTQISYNPIESNINYCYNKSANKALIFGTKAGLRRMVEIDKTTLANTNLSVIPYTSSVTYSINYVLNTDTNKFLICGSSLLSRESITYYNSTIQDTVWKNTYGSSFSSQIIKCVIDPLKQFIYTAASNANDIVIRKISLANGLQKWSYTYNGAASLNDFPMDIVHDSITNQILLTGYETNATNKQVLILKLDTAGNLLNSITKIGDFAGDNKGTCVNVLYDGTQWVGGNLNKNSYGLAGFVFELNSPLYSLLSSFNISSNWCTNQNIQLTDFSSNSPTQWAWSATPSTGISFNTNSIQNPTLTASVAGIYSITLTAGNLSGPGTSFTQTLTINPSPTVSVANSSQTICAGNSVSYTASGAASYTWSNGGGNAITANYTPTNSSIFYVTGMSSSCSNSTSVSVTLLPLPLLTVISTNSILCFGQTATLNISGANTYSWSTAATSSSILINPTTTTTFSVIGTGANGCNNFNSYTQTVSALPSLTVASSNSVLCAGQIATLTVNGANTYTWNTSSSTSSILINPNITSTYSVNGTDINGCNNSTTITQTVVALPTLTVTSNNSIICVGQFATLTVNGASTYTWSNSSSTTSIVINPTITSTYSVNGTDVNGCSNSTSITQLVSVCTEIGSNTSNLIAYNLFPNPNNGFFNLIIENQFVSGELILTNQLGQKVFIQKISSGKNNIITTCELNKGLYNYLILIDETPAKSGLIAIE